MRLTLSDMVAYAQDAVGGDTSTASKTFFKQRINYRYELVASKLPSYLSETTDTFTTVASTQYYDFFPNLREIESVIVTIGSVDYVLEEIESWTQWRQFNAIDIQAGAIPQVYFKRDSDFGIWPIPQDAYTATVVYSQRAGGMVNEDYTTGTVTTVKGDATIEGAATTWTGGNANAGQWFSLADSNGESKGGWYKISSITDADTLELTSNYNETGAAGESYIIGDSPFIPPEGHILLAQGAVADYWAEKRQNLARAQNWNNMFWTGDWNVNKNTARKDPRWTGGLTGLINSYKDRSDSQLIKRRRRQEHARNKLFATDIS